MTEGNTDRTTLPAAEAGLALAEQVWRMPFVLTMGWFSFWNETMTAAQTPMVPPAAHPCPPEAIEIFLETEGDHLLFA